MTSAPRERKNMQIFAGYDENDEELFMETPPIRPCPRCGSKAEWQEEGFESYIILCSVCEYYLDDTLGSIEDMAYWWNLRPLEDKLRKEIESLKNNKEPT